MADAPDAAVMRRGIAGIGAIAHGFASPLEHVPDAEAVAVSSPTPGRAAAFGSAHGIARAYDHAALAEDVVGDGFEMIGAESPSLHHQVPDVHAAIRAGALECARWPWVASLELLELTDEVRSQIGLRYPSE